MAWRALLRLHSLASEGCQSLRPLREAGLMGEGEQTCPKHPGVVLDDRTNRCNICDFPALAELFS